MFSQYKWLIIGGLFAVAVAGGWWYKSKADTLELQLTAAIEDVAEIQASLDASKALAHRNYDLYLQQTQEVKAIERASRAKTAVINKYKNREDVVYAKPGLVEKLEQKELDKFFEEVSNGR